MEIWLDTIDAKLIARAHKMGVLHGVTTNPAILSKSTLPAEKVVEELLSLFTGPLAVQVTRTKAEEMVDQGKRLHQFSSRIIIKIPAIEEGYKAMHSLTAQGIPVMATTIFSPLQALLALEAGATYFAPYYSHLGANAFAVCQSIHRLLSSNKKLLVAALTDLDQVLISAESGFAAVTLKGPLFEQMLQAPAQTVEHLARFAAAWKEAPTSSLLA